jgi:GTP:adenosylcobinamide-phosphate guanylyltransferase
MTVSQPLETLPRMALGRLEGLARRYPAVLVAGDRHHSRSVAGRSKGFVEVAGQPMVLHVLDALLRTPAVSDVFVVGDAKRLGQCFAESQLLERAARASRSVHIVPQRETLYENVWQAFLRSLPAARSDLDHTILVVPADIPLVVPEELSDFIRRAADRDVDYVLGITPDLALERFAPREGQPGIAMACFNLREGRFRQNNLHLVRPLRMGNRHYIEDMYAARHQREVSSMVWLGLQVFFREFRKLWVLAPYVVLHLAGVLDRGGWQRCARLVSNLVGLATLERAASALLCTRVAAVVTRFGGAALDVDNEADCEVADKMFAAWRSIQLEPLPPAMLCARE